ncbi:hypothetical protein GCM10027048_17840 [Hymenobacter coalescens]
MVITVPDVVVTEEEFAVIATRQWLSRRKNRWPLWIYSFAALVFLALLGLRLSERAGDPSAPWPAFELFWLAFICLYMFWWRRYRLKQYFRKAYRS